MEFNTLTIPVVFTGSFSRVFNIKRIVRESQLIGTKNFDLLKKNIDLLEKEVDHDLVEQAIQIGYQE